MRSSNLADLRQQAERLKQGGRFKTIAIYRWNYETEEDDILVEDFGD